MENNGWGIDFNGHPEPEAEQPAMERSDVFASDPWGGVNPAAMSLSSPGDGFSMMSTLGSAPGIDGAALGTIYKDIVAIPHRAASTSSAISQIDLKWYGNITTGLSTSTVDTTEVKASIFVYGERSGANAYDTPAIAIGGTWNSTLYAPATTWGTNSAASVANIFLHPATGVIEVSGEYRASNGTTYGKFNGVQIQPNSTGFQMTGGTSTAKTLTVGGSLNILSDGSLDLQTYTLQVAGANKSFGGTGTSLSLSSNGTLDLQTFTLQVTGANKSFAGAGTSLTLSSNVTIAGGGFTLTLGGNFTSAAAVTFSGAFGFTGTLTGTTSVTFPTGGTLVTTAPNAGSAATSQIISGGSVDQIALAIRGTSNVTNRDIVQFYQSGTTQTAGSADAGVNYQGIFYGNGSLLTSLSGSNISSGLVALNYGGTGANLSGVGATNGIVYKTSTTAMSITTAGASNQLLISGPSWANITSLLTAGTGITSLGSGATATIAVATGVAFTWSGQHTFSYAPATGVANNWTMLISGSPFAQASGALIEIGPGPWDGSTSGFFSGNSTVNGGTYIGLNSASTFVGNFVDFQVHGSSNFSLSYAGAITMAGGIASSGSIAATGFTVSGNSVITSVAATTTQYGAISFTGTNGLTVSNSGSVFTVSASGGTVVTGSGTNNYVAYWNGTNTLTGEATLAVSRGGTNKASWTANSVPYISATNTFNEDNTHFGYTGSTNQELLLGVSTQQGRLTVGGSYTNNFLMVSIAGTVTNAATTIYGQYITTALVPSASQNGCGIASWPQFSSGVAVNAAIAFSASLTLTASQTGNLALGYGYFVHDGSNAGTGTLAAFYGLYVQPLTLGTSNVGVSSNIASGASNWNIYAAGTASNAYAGKSYFGGTTSPTGYVTIAAGSTSVPAIQLTAGSQLTSATSGAVEWDGTSLYVTSSVPTRRTLLYIDFSNIGANLVPLANGGTNASNTSPSNGQILVGTTTSFVKATLGTGTYLTSTTGSGSLSIDLKAANSSSTPPTGNTYTVAIYDTNGYLYANTPSTTLGANGTAVANKAYVDALVQGATVHQSVRAASITAFESTLGTTGFGAGGASGTAFYNSGSITTNQGGTYAGYITLAPTTTNNTTGQAVANSGTNPVIYNAFDQPGGAGGSSLNIGDRVLIKDFSTSGTYNSGANTARSVANGIYIVQTTGTTPFTIVLCRTLDASINADIAEGAYTLVEEGATWKYSGWMQIDSLSGTIALNPANALASTALSAAGGPQFTQFNGLTDIIAANGLNSSGNTISSNIILSNVVGNGSSTNVGFQLLGGGTSGASGNNLNNSATGSTQSLVTATFQTANSTANSTFTFTGNSTGFAIVGGQATTTLTVSTNSTLNFNGQTLTLTSSTGSGTLNLNSQTLTLTSSTGGGTLNLNSGTINLGLASSTITLTMSATTATTLNVFANATAQWNLSLQGASWSGITNLAAGSIPYVASTTFGALSLAAAGTATQVLIGGTTPSFGAVTLTSMVSGILPIANGGTNSNTASSAGSVVYSTASAMAYTAVGSSNQVLMSNGTSAPSWVSITTVGIGGSIVSPEVAFGSGTNTISGAATFVYTSSNLGVGVSSPAQRVDIGYGHLRFTQLNGPGAPTVATGVAGLLTGNYYYAVSFVTPQGESNLGTASAVVAPSSQQVSVTAIPTDATGNATSRKLYRTTTGGVNTGPFYLLTTIGDNTTTTYTDNTVDGSLGTVDFTHRPNTTAGLIYIGTSIYGQLGGYNTAIGLSSLASVVNTGSTYNTAFGTNTLPSVTIGNFNTAVGSYAVNSTTSGSSNTGVGYSAGFSMVANNGGSFVGSFSGRNITGGNNSTFGFQAGYGPNNVTANASTTGTGNTFLGSQSGQATTTQVSTSIAIGFNALVTGSNQAVIGGTVANSAAVKVGINNANPSTAQLSLVTDATSTIGILVNGLTSQTADLQDWSVNSSILASINSAGQFQTFGGGVISTFAGITNTSTQGMALQNTTASTSGSTVQWSPAKDFIGHAWNTTVTAADNYVRMRNELQTTSGAAPSGSLVWKSSVDTGTASFTNDMVLTTVGQLQLPVTGIGAGILLGGVSTANLYYDATNTKLRTSGSLAVDNSLGVAIQAPAQRVDIGYGHLRFTPLGGPGAPTVATGVAGLLTGNYYYAVTFVTPQGETNMGTASAVVAPSSQKVNLTAIPTDATNNATSRNIYRTTTGGVNTGPFYLVTTIADNTTTTYTDNTVDGSLGTTDLTHRANTTGGQIYVGATLSGFADGASFSTAFGNSALASSTGGSSNSAFGMNALRALTTATSNVAVGDSALIAVTTSGANTGLGHASGLALTTGAGNNTFVGSSAGRAVTTSGFHTFVGTNAGYSPNGVSANGTTTTAGNTFLGYQSGAATSTQIANAIAIGINSVVTGSNQAVIGGTSTYAVKVGINNTNPSTAQLSLVTDATSTIGILVNGAASQSADLQDWAVNGSNVATLNNLGQFTGFTSGSTGGIVLFATDAQSNLYRSSAGVVKTDGAFVAANGITSLGSGIVDTLNNIQTTSTEGFALQNTTATTSGTVAQWSPAFDFIGHVWNTTVTAADNYARMRNELQVTSGTTPIGTLVWKGSVDTGTASFTNVMTLTTAGALSIPTSGVGINATPNGQGTLNMARSISSSTTNQFVVSNTMTNPAAVGIGAYIASTYNSTTAGSIAWVIGGESSALITIPSTANTISITNSAVGMLASAQYDIGGTNVTVNNLAALHLDIETSGGGAAQGTITNGFGINSFIAYQATSNALAITNHYGARFNLSVANGNTVGTSYGTYISSPVLSGTGAISTAYGIYVSDQTVSGITNKYGIWLSGTAGNKAAGLFIGDTVTNWYRSVASTMQTDAMLIVGAPAFVATSGSQIGATVTQNFTPGSSPSSSVTGLQVQATQTNANLSSATNPVVGGNFQAISSGTASYGTGVNFVGLQAFVNNSSTGTIGSAIGLLLPGTTNASGTVTRSSELQITASGIASITANSQQRSGIHFSGAMPTPGAFTSTVSAAIWFDNSSNSAREGLLWGAAGTTQSNLYQNAAGVLRADQNFSVGGQVSIGASSASYSLDIWLSGGGQMVRVTDNNTVNLGMGVVTSTSSWMGSVSNHPLALYTNNLARINVTAAGLVGINATPSAVQLQVTSSGSTTQGLVVTSAATPSVNIADFQLNGSSALTVDSGGNTRIQSKNLYLRSTGTNDLLQYNGTLDGASLQGNKGVQLASSGGTILFSVANTGSSAGGAFVYNQFASAVGLTVQGYTSQTADILQIVSSTPTVLASFSSSGALKLFNSGFSVSVAPQTLSGNVNFALPNSNGTLNYYLQTDGSGNTSWTQVPFTSLSGIASMAQGGTGANLTGIAGQIVYTASSTQMAVSTGGSTNNILQFNSGSAPTWTGTPTLTSATFTAANSITPITVNDSSDSSVSKFRVDLVNQAVILGADTTANPRKFPICLTLANNTGVSSYNAVTAFTLVKLNSYGGVTQLLTTDDASLAIGVALNTVTGSSSQIVYVARFGRVSVWTDTTGGGIISVGDYLIASTNTAGYGMHASATRPSSGASYFGRALTGNNGSPTAQQIDVLIDINETTTTGSGNVTGSGLSAYFLPVTTAALTISNSMVQQDASSGTVLTIGSVATHRVVIGGSSNGANSGAIALPGNTQTTAAYGITFSNDGSNNLYRSTTNTLKTDGSFVTGASILATTSVTATTSLSAGGGGFTVNSTGTATILPGAANANVLVLQPNADSSTGSSLLIQNAAGSSNLISVTAKGAMTFTPVASSITPLIIKNPAADDGGTVIKLQVQNSSAGSLFSVDSSGNLAAVTKSFIIDNPVDPETKIHYGSLEGPEHGVYARGEIYGKGDVRVDLPDYWIALVGDDYTVNLTPEGPYQVYKVQKDSRGFVVRRGGLFGKWRPFGFTFTVIGCRKDVVIDEVVFRP